MRKLSLEELGRCSVEDYKKLPKREIVLVLDNIRSALNVGSAFRTADSFALKSIQLCGISATPPHREILKTAIGATQSVDWNYEKDILKVILQLKSNGYKVYGVEQTDHSVHLQNFDFNPKQKIALVFGNEVNGLTEDILPELDACIEVPQFGTKHSLNVAVCLGLVVWDFVKKTLKV